VDVASVLELFDRQLRRESAPSDPAVRIERDARTVLWIDEGGWSAVLWSDLDEASADETIARVADRLRALGGEAEWKLYGHDRPADLPRRLEAAGLEPGEQEAVLVAEIAALDLDAAPPEGVELRVVADAGDVAAFVEAAERGFDGESHEGVGRMLLRALEREPPTDVGVVALAGGTPVGASRISFDAGSDFAGLWGGATVPEWRGRGLYRATVALRGRLARERGYRYLQVDALPTSRPILERLGFVQLTTTTPYTPRRV